jgi:hypothetical protein
MSGQAGVLAIIIHKLQKELRCNQYAHNITSYWKGEVAGIENWAG